MKKVLLASVAVAALVTTGSVQAGWIGDTIDVSYYFPDLSTLYLPQFNQQTFTVPGSGSFTGIAPDGSFDQEIGYSVGGAQITITNVNIPSNFDPGTFNGPVLRTRAATRISPTSCSIQRPICPAFRPGPLTRCP